MPNLGTPSASVRPPSHTSSDQWQSFEIKMRHRRAERCVLRAEAALEAGQDDEAREALAEARTLNPQSPDFDTLKARLGERQAAAAADVRRTRRLKLSVAAAAALLLGVGTFGFFGVGGVESPTRIADGSSQERGVPPASGAVATSSRSESVDSAAARIVPTEGTRAPGPPAEAPPRQEPATAPAVTVPQAADPQSAVPDDRTAKPAATNTPPASTPPVPEPPLPAVRAAEPDIRLPRPVPQPTTTETLTAGTVSPPASVDRPPSGLPTAAVPEPVSLPAPPVPPAPPVEERVMRAEASDDQKVRAVLAQFEAAYSSLDAAAARAVWPSVDEGSLARAFASLESQRVALGACSIRITGTVARADCSGTSSWTPKIGGGRRSEPRRWSFDLQSADGAWRIVNAQAR